MKQRPRFSGPFVLWDFAQNANNAAGGLHCIGWGRLSAQGENSARKTGRLFARRRHRLRIGRAGVPRCLMRQIAPGPRPEHRAETLLARSAELPGRLKNRRLCHVGLDPAVRPVRAAQRQRLGLARFGLRALLRQPSGRQIERPFNF